MLNLLNEIAKANQNKLERKVMEQLSWIKRIIYRSKTDMAENEIPDEKHYQIGKPKRTQKTIYTRTEK